MFTFVLLLALYFLPSLIAAHRGHRVVGLFLLNLLFGWTGIGWLVLLFHATMLAPRWYGTVPVSFEGAPPPSTWQRF